MELAVNTLPPSLAGPELCNKVVGVHGFTLFLICYYYSRETINFNFFSPPPKRQAKGNRDSEQFIIQLNLKGI